MGTLEWNGVNVDLGLFVEFEDTRWTFFQVLTEYWSGLSGWDKWLVGTVLAIPAALAVAATGGFALTPALIAAGGLAAVSGGLALAAAWDTRLGRAIGHTVAGIGAMVLGGALLYPVIPAAVAVPMGVIGLGMEGLAAAQMAAEGGHDWIDYLDRFGPTIAVVGVGLVDVGARAAGRLVARGIMSETMRPVLRGLDRIIGGTYGRLSGRREFLEGWCSPG